MSIEVELVRDLAVIMVVAAVIVALFVKLRQPVILGYLIAGIIIGPYTPPFSYVTQLEFLRVFAELGIILLLFSIGLDFPIAKLRKIGRVSVGVALFEMGVMLSIGFLVASAFQWPILTALFLAAALSISSTAIVMKILEEYRVLNEEASLIMLGILIVEDIAAVVIMAGLQSVAAAGFLQLEVVLLTLVKGAALIAGTLILGNLVIPRLMDKVVGINRLEITLLSALGLCFGLSIIASVMEFSVAIGAFLAGVLVAESKSREHIAQLSRPLKETFAAVFFVSMGALMDFTQFPAFVIPAIIIVLVTIAAKLMSVSFGVKTFGYSTVTALRSGLGMVQIGEFSFIIVALGMNLNVVDPFLLPLVGTVALVTSFLTPYLIRVGLELRQA